MAEHITRKGSIARQYRANESIRSPEVRVIGNAGEQLGILSSDKALALAREQGLDLVEVAPNSEPPVCRILDFGKLRYLAAKKERGARKNQKSTGLREVRFRPNIGEHDLLSKVRKVKQLLEDGAKVKAAVVFRGRQITHSELGLVLLKQVADEVKEEAKLEMAPALEGRSLSIILAPVAKKPEKRLEEIKSA